MKTEISVAKDNPTVLKQAGNILKNGGLVAFPTETVYGLGADALNENAAKKTYEAKGRPSDNPLIVHIATMDALPKIVKNIPEKARKVAETYWPGPLTMVFEKSDVVPYGTTGGLDTVAVRFPDHELAQALIIEGGGYISAPSANSSGRPSPTTAGHVAEDLSGKIDMILDGGAVEIGVESTILDVTVEPPMILRPGAISAEMLQEVIGAVEVDKAILDAESTQAPKAPGMKYRHYAPKAKLIVVEGTQEDSVKAIQKLCESLQHRGVLSGVIGTDETVAQYSCGIVKSIGSREDEASIAHNLYGVLRAFDQEKVEYIYSEAFFGEGIGHAIMNRLLKAAGQQVLDAKTILEQDILA